MHGYLIVVEHYLFHDANSLPSSKLEENNEFVSAYFCVLNGSYCLLSFKHFLQRTVQNVDDQLTVYCGRYERLVFTGTNF